MAFYDAVALRDMAKAMEGGDDTLAKIARALVKDIQKSLSVDWLSREPRPRQAPYPHPPRAGAGQGGQVRSIRSRRTA
ncbi:hypothetical protein ADL35_34325 [Streptomyces sp. NRRL WC-3753]|nr:hypothetical protein ADL35_34325 [Streptomyces sp. NRRL WC-3753]